MLNKKYGRLHLQDMAVRAVYGTVIEYIFVDAETEHLRQKVFS